MLESFLPGEEGPAQDRRQVLTQRLDGNMSTLQIFEVVLGTHQRSRREVSPRIRDVCRVAYASPVRVEIEL